MSESLMDYPNLEVLGLDPPWVEGSGGTVGEVEPTGLAAMTKAELLDYARAHDVTPANNDMTKDELRASIEAAGA
jgi:hypothetical protein